MKVGSNLDLSQLQILNAVFQNLAAAPSSPKAGQVYYNTVSNVGAVWNGSAWRPTDAAALTDGSVALSALAVNPLARANHTGTQLSSTISDLSTVVQAYSLSAFASPTTAILMGSQKISNLANGTAAQDAVAFAQMNSAIAAAVSGQTAVKNPVRAVATANLTLSGTQTVDGVALVAGDRVLLTAQTTASQNNIYVVAAGAWALATDVASTGQLIEGTDVLVAEGTTYGGSIFRVTTTGTITIGTTSITWVQTTKINTYSGSTTVLLTGSAFSVITDPAGWLTANASGVAADKTKIAGKFLGTITGDGTTTSFAFTHNLNITNPFLSVRDSSGNQILADNQATSANALSVTFSVAPPVSTNYTVTIIG